MASGAWSYTSGTSDVPLLGLTIGDMFDQTAARYPDNEALVSRHQGLRYTYRQLQAGGRPLRPGADRPRRRQGPAGRHLGAELRRVGDHPVRDGQDRRDPRQHQPELPAARAAVRAQAVRLRLARHRAAVQDLRLHGDAPRAGARAGRQPARRRSRPPRFPTCAAWSGWATSRRRGCSAGARCWRWPSGSAPTSWPRRQRAAGVRRPDQHPVHQRHHRLSQGRHAQPPQHPQQRLLHHRAAALHRPRPAAHPGAALPLLRHGAWATWAA